MNAWLDNQTGRAGTMAIHAAVGEAGTRLEELIKAVENGEEVVLTRNGEPVARLAPPAIDLSLPRGSRKMLPDLFDPAPDELMRPSNLGRARLMDQLDSIKRSLRQFKWMLATTWVLLAANLLFK
jgi:prevent-host-death family protein